MNIKARSEYSPIHKVAATLVLLCIGILFLHLITVGSSLLWPDFYISRLSSLFDLDQEKNVPTVVISGLLGLCAFISFKISKQSKRFLDRLSFISLGLFFLYLAADELLMIHERFAAPIRNVLSIGNGSLLYHAWVIPALLVVGIGIVYLVVISVFNIVKNDVYNRLIFYITIFILGVVVMEIIGTKLFPYTIIYRLISVTVEEGIELVMSSILLISLLTVPMAKLRNPNNEYRYKS